MGTNRANYPRLLQSTPGPTSHGYGSVNGHFPSNVEPSVMEGVSVDGKISAARRFFILLTVFDVSFSFLVWIICIIISGEYTISTAFRNEVLNYSIETSMFDVVMLAVARLFLITLFYVFVRISHWWVVAVTTAGTSVFVVSKVFLYQWIHSSKTAAVVLLLCSFVLSWGEAWFLDFRVLPNESKALSFLATQDIERAPVLSHPALSRSQSDEGSAFYSPPGSDTEDNGKEHDGSTVSEVEWLSPKSSNNLQSMGDSVQTKPIGYPVRLEEVTTFETDSTIKEKDYKKLAEEALQKALDIMESDGWKKEKVDGKDVIYTKIIPTYGKVFKLVGILHISPEKIIDELYFKAEEMHKWNPTVKKVKVVQRISENVDIAHVIASEGAAGLVASRDFINLRIWKKQNSGYVHGTVGTTHPDVPVVTKYVRGEQGPGAYIITPTSTSENCELQWLLNTNLKGWIPQYLIDQTLSSVMIEYMQSLRKHCAKSCG